MPKKEKRHPIICPCCHKEMVCMNRFESIYKLLRGFYIWYICPHREGENGCGHTVLLEISPTTKRPRKILNPSVYKKVLLKRKLRR